MHWVILIKSSRFAARFQGISRLCSAFITSPLLRLTTAFEELVSTKATQPHQSGNVLKQMISCNSTHPQYRNLQAVLARKC